MTELDTTKALPIKAAYAFGVEKGFEKEIAEIRSMQVDWNRSYKTTVRRGYIVELFERKGIWGEFRDRDWPNWQTSDGRWRYRQYKKLKVEYDTFLEQDADETDEAERAAEPEAPDAFAFALEAELRDFIAYNLNRLPLAGKALKLHEDERGRGVEYSTEVGRIDILAVDQNEKFYVFELKLSRGPDRALGQLARYMGWVKQKLADGQDVQGVVVARSIDEKLRYAAVVVPNVTLLEYDVAFKLNPAPAPSAK